MAQESWPVRPVGWVESALGDVTQAARQPDEDAPACRIRLTTDVEEAAADLRAGDRVVVLTWLHLADRACLVVHPRGDRDAPLTGVFSTRSPHRPNPVGLHTVTLTRVERHVIEVDHLEAVHGTPVIDIKPVLGAITQR